ncbi:MAG: carotenoid biosynthesis protein [Ferruginibacter sp.]
MFFLILFTQKEITKTFLIFLTSCVVIGISAEVIGIKTGWLFGSYSYGNVLGPKIMEVPVIIGINWFIIIYCCGISVATMLRKLTLQLPEGAVLPRPRLQVASMLVDGAMLAVLFDWILEPVAIKLGYWTWKGSEVPFYNYLCWFVISCCLLAIFHFCSFEKENKFAVNLLLIQAMFFLLLRTFL